MGLDMFKNEKVLINYYSGVLWDTWVVGAKHRELTKSNFYEKEVGISRDSSGDIVSIKSDLVESRVRQANIFEVGILKYLFIAIFAWFLFNINLYYTSMLGLFIGSFAYIGFYQLKQRVSDFFAWFFLFVIFSVYLFLFIGFPAFAFEHKLNWIINYSIQYFLWLYLFERVFIDIYTMDFKKWYKIESLNLAYFKMSNEEDVKDFDLKSEVAKNLFLSFTILVMSVGLFFGGVDMWMKINTAKKADEILMTKNNDEIGVVSKKNSGVCL